MVLMHTSQPAWLLDQSSRLLVLLSTRMFSFYKSANICLELYFVDHTLFRVFLNIPSPEMQNTGVEETTKNPFIERLCSHLIETSNSEPEVIIFL